MRTLLVSECMTPSVKTVHEDDTMTSADWDMAIGEIRHLIVLDPDRRVIGVISDRDVSRSLIEHRGRPVAVGAMMSRALLTVAPTTPAVEAVATMLRHKCHALPVVDAERRLLGIITATDFLELAHRALSGLEIDRGHARA
jgi:CBS domain-containing membrane protein